MEGQRVSDIPSVLKRREYLDGVKPEIPILRYVTRTLTSPDGMSTHEVKVPVYDMPRTP